MQWLAVCCDKETEVVRRGMELNGFNWVLESFENMKRDWRQLGSI